MYEIEIFGKYVLSARGRFFLVDDDKERYLLISRIESGEVDLLENSSFKFHMQIVHSSMTGEEVYRLLEIVQHNVRNLKLREEIFCFYLYLFHEKDEILNILISHIHHLSDEKILNLLKVVPDCSLPRMYDFLSSQIKNILPFVDYFTDRLKFRQQNGLSVDSFYFQFMKKFLPEQEYEREILLEDYKKDEFYFQIFRRYPTEKGLRRLLEQTSNDKLYYISRIISVSDRIKWLFLTGYRKEAIQCFSEIRYFSEYKILFHFLVKNKAENQILQDVLCHRLQKNYSRIIYEKTAVLLCEVAQYAPQTADYLRKELLHKFSSRKNLIKILENSLENPLR